jgi:late competence protein required for DNA uptake (superfamily II DNA/RNA helicase)
MKRYKSEICPICNSQAYIFETKLKKATYYCRVSCKHCGGFSYGSSLFKSRAKKKAMKVWHKKLSEIQKTSIKGA